jgi:hypothetical protein
MKEVLNETLMWVCYFKSGDIMVRSLAYTRKASTRAATAAMKLDKWTSARKLGIRCDPVIIQRLGVTPSQLNELIQLTDGKI